MPGNALEAGDIRVKKKGSFHSSYLGSTEIKQDSYRGINTVIAVEQSMMWASRMGEGAKERLLYSHWSEKACYRGGSWEGPDDKGNHQVKI